MPDVDLSGFTEDQLQSAIQERQAAGPSRDDLNSMNYEQLQAALAQAQQRQLQDIEPHYQKAIQEEVAAQNTPAWSMERALNSGIVNSYFIRKYSGTGFVGDIQAGRAQSRLDRGEASDEDKMTIARHRLQQNLDQQIEQGQTPLQRAGTQIGELPASLAQLLAGGKIAQALTPIAEGPGVARAVAGTVAEANLNPAFVPMMTVQKNLEAGRDPFDIAGVAPAEALGVIQLATLKAGGALAGKVMPNSPLGQLAVAAGTGPIVQQATELASHAAGLETTYGAWQMAREGKWGEAGAKLFNDLVTFGVFHAAHGGGQKGAEKVMEEATKALDAEAKAGYPLPEAIERVQDTVATAMRLEGLGFVDPTKPLTFQEAQAIRRAGKWAPGSPASDQALLDAMIAAIPEKVSKRPRVAPQTPQGAQPQPAVNRPQVAPDAPQSRPESANGPPPVGSVLPNGDVMVQGPVGPIPRSVAEKMGFQVEAPQAPVGEENPRQRADRLTREFQVEQKRLNNMGFSAPQIDRKLKDQARELSKARDEAFVWEAQHGPPVEQPQIRQERRGTHQLGEPQAVGENLARHPVLDSAGKEIGGITVEREGDRLKIKSVATDEDIGTGALKGIVRALGEAYPDATEAEFIRTTGPNAGKLQRIPIGKNGRGKPSSLDDMLADIGAKHGIAKANKALDEAALKGSPVSFDDIFRSHGVSADEGAAFLAWNPEAPGGGRSLRDIATEHGVSHETIRKRINSAIEKMGLPEDYKARVEAEVKGNQAADLVEAGKVTDVRQLSNLEPEAIEAFKRRASETQQRWKAWEKYINKKGRLTDEDRTRIGEAIGRGEWPKGYGRKAAKRQASEPPPVQDSGEPSVPERPPTIENQEPGAREAPAARPGGEVANTRGGQAAGNELTNIVLPNGGRIPARYQVRDAYDVRASHQVRGNGSLRERPDAEYPKSLQPRDYSAPGEQEKVDRIARDIEPAVLINKHPAASEGPPTITPDGTVINGNGRQMSLERAIDRGTYGKYKSELLKNLDQYGINPDDVQGMKNPVLYRVVEMDPRSDQARTFAAAGNVSMTQAQSPVRAAASLGRLITPEVIDAMRLEGDSTFSEAVTQPGGRAFRERLRSELPPQERARFFNEDATLTDAGVELVRNMLLAKIIPADLIERMGEEMRRPKQSIEGVIPQLLLTMRDFPAANIAPQLNEALNVWARNYKMRSIADADNVLAQRGLFGGMAEELSPGGRMMLDFLLDNAFEPRTFRKKLKNFVEDLAGANGLFGEEYPDVVSMAAEHLGVEPRVGAAFGDIDAAVKEVDNAAREAIQAGHSPQEVAEVSRSEQAAGVDEGDERAADFGLGASAGGVPARLPGAGAPGVGVGIQPQPVQRGNATGSWYQQLRDGLKAFAQQAFPATTRLDRLTGEKLAQVANAPNAAKAGWDYYSRILKIDGKPLRELTDAQAQLAGAVWIERRFRWAREELDRMGKDTSHIPTLVGQPDSPLTSEKVFQDNLDGMYSFFEAVKQEWTREVEKNFRGVMGLDPFDAIDSPTQEPGLPLNLIALSEDNPTQGVVKVGRKETLANLRLRKPGFTKEAQFSADAYDIDLRHMMQRTLELGTAAGRRAEWARSALEGGTLLNLDKGQQAPEGWRALPISPAHGLPGLDPKGRYVANPETYQDFVQGLGISDRPGQVLLAKALKVVNDKITAIALMTPVELATHTGNHFTALFQEGMGTPIYNLKDSFANAWKVWQGEPEIMRRVYELAKIGAAFGHDARPGILGAGMEAKDPTAWVGKFTSKFIDTMQKAVRVQLDTAYTSLVRQGLKPNTETARRDFINQALGNYQAGAGSRLVQFIKDMGLQPFATAAATFTTQGAKKALLMPNAPDTGVASAAKNRAIAALKLMPFLTVGPVLNSINFGQAFPKGTPPFAIKTRDDEDGKTHYIDPLAFTGLRRGWRAIGLNSLIEAYINGGKSSGEMLDKAVRDWKLTGEHFVAGPLVQAIHTAATGENMMGHRVAPKVSTAQTPKGQAAAAKKGLPEKGSSQTVQDVGAALANLNPLYAAMVGADKPKGDRTFWERLSQSFGPFGERTREAEKPKKK